MKKTLFLSMLMLGAGGAIATAQVIENPSFGDNWSIGVDGGVTTPFTGAPFFKSMRPEVGLRISKQITPVLKLGAEGQFDINTTNSKTAFDQSYVGVYGDIDLFNLFGGYQCKVRPFSISAVAGAGWGHDFVVGDGDYNYFSTKAGLDFNFNVSDNVTIDLQPTIHWNMNDADVSQTATAFNAKKARVSILAGVTYHFGKGFKCVAPYDAAEVAALNAQINSLRGDLDGALANSIAWENRANALASQLADCQNTPVETITEVVTEVNNNLNSVRYVFFKIGSSTITADQMPNVEMIAAYLKNHPDATVEIMGYASQDGPEDVNIRLANNRAEAVKTALINKYGVSADRITAKGQGIGHMFKEESWNRVSICTIEDDF